MDFDQDQVIVRATRYDAETTLGNCRGHRLGVRHDLLLIFLEGWLHRFLQAHRFRRNRVHQRTALRPWERQPVQFLGKRGLAEDQAAAWSTQCLMRSGGNDVGVGYWARMNSSSNETGNVGHIHKKERANGLRGFRDALEINDARIGARASDAHLGLMLCSEPFNLALVHPLIFLLHTLGYELVHPSGEIQRMSVR